MVTVSKRTAEFLFYRPGAQQVHLVGDFNGWREGAMPMSLAAGGYWRARMLLPPGRFKFRYLADGQWYTDHAAFGVQQGPFGWDSIVHVAG